MTISSNPYQPPDAPLSDIALGATEDELAAFVGPNCLRYLDQWDGLRAGTKRSAGFNWSAFLAAVFWCVYRRLYWEALVLVVALIIISVSEAALIDSGLLSPTTVSVVSYAAMLALYVTLGFTANPWYFQKAERAIAAARSESRGANESHLPAVASSGGVRPKAVWFSILGVLTLSIALGQLGAAA